MVVSLRSGNPTESNPCRDSQRWRPFGASFSYTGGMEFPGFGEWSKPSFYGETSRLHHLYSTATADPLLMPQFGPIKKMRWTKMLPGGFIAPHIDASPYNVRWQVPFSPAGFWWSDGEASETGMEPFRVEHWKPHAVWNPTAHDRIHLVVDLEHAPTDAPPNSPLILFDLLPEIEEMLLETA